MYRRRKRTRQAPKARTKEEKCATKWCRNRRAAKITRHRMANGKVKEFHSQLPVCWKCKSKRLKERHPATYVLNALRVAARRRRIPCTLTLAQFEDWCEQTGYLQNRGQEPTSATIDRINHNEGYHIWNIKVLNHLENSTNGHTVPGEDSEQNAQQPDYPERDPQQHDPCDYASPEDCPF